MSSSSLVFSLALPSGGPASAVRRTRSNGSCSICPLSSSGSIARRNQSLRLNSRLIRGSGPTDPNTRPLVCRSQLAELAPATSAVYGVLLLGGGLFACQHFPHVFPSMLKCFLSHCSCSWFVISSSVRICVPTIACVYEEPRLVLFSLKGPLHMLSCSKCWLQT